MYAIPAREVRLSAELQREKKGLGETFLVTNETPAGRALRGQFCPALTLLPSGRFL